MRVLVACEFSARVRDAFRRLGHEAYSCDTSPTIGDPRWHIQADALTVAHWENYWDLMVAFPPCTHLTLAGNRAWRGTTLESEAVGFVKALWRAPVPRVAIENPRGVLSHHLGKPQQIVDPWWFGHPYRKMTCLWLRNLPPLAPTDIVWHGGESYHHNHRGLDRSLTFPGVADAMANQWGSL